MFGELVIVDDVAAEFAERVIECFHARPNDGYSMRTSSTTASGDGSASNRCSASSPELASSTSKPADVSTRRATRRTSGSSSTTSTVGTDQP